MAWLPDGTFERVTNNTQEDGISLWQQDLSNNVKVVAYRHDFHDHDLAGGIAACLNLDGYNSMRANLNMGGYSIINIPDAALTPQVPTYGQCAGTMSYTSGTGLLELYDRSGDLITSVVLTPGSGGTGTVTSITAGEGLVADPATINTTGELSLEAIGIGQSYSGGLAGIVIDDYGRVTQVTTGGFANTNLSISTSATLVGIFSSTGSDASIASANSAKAGCLTAVDWSKIQAAPTLFGDNEFLADNTFSGDLYNFSGSVKFGQQGLPTILAEGLQINSDGRIFAVNLPTSDPGSTGQVYNDGGTLKVSL